VLPHAVQTTRRAPLAMLLLTPIERAHRIVVATAPPVEEAPWPRRHWLPERTTSRYAASQFCFSTNPGASALAPASTEPAATRWRRDGRGRRPLGITAALGAASGGRSSPFSLLYPLPVLHAARVGAALCAVVEVFSWRFPIAGRMSSTARRHPRTGCGLEVGGVQVLATADSLGDPVVDPLGAGGGAP
jgi:hypothetical protein